MDTVKSWIAELLRVSSEYLRQGIDYLPNMIGALSALILGWLLARLARRGVQGLANGANKLIDQAFPIGARAGLSLSPLAISIIGEVLFWFVVLVSWAVALRVAGLNAISLWLDRITVYLPNLAAALVVFLLGFLLSILLREQLAKPTKSQPGAGRQKLPAKFAQGAIVLTAAIVALDQLGIEVALLISLAVVFALAISIPLAIAFGFGARRHVSNLIGVRSARQHLMPGQVLRVDDIQGTILQISSTTVTLETQAGTAFLPGYLLDEQVVTIIPSELQAGANDEQ